MLVFATSDKGGTGRSVTSCNIAYRMAIQGRDTCYLDFDFGSPTAGAIFSIPSAMRGVARGGLHSYLAGSNQVVSMDVWRETDRATVKGRPDGAGRLVLFPGDIGGSEFAPDAETIQRCARLLLRMDEEFSLVLIDLSAGRSHALDTVLAATALPRLKKVTCRWLVFHRQVTFFSRGKAVAARTAGTTAMSCRAASGSCGPPSSTRTPTTSPACGPNRSSGCATATSPCKTWPAS